MVSVELKQEKHNALVSFLMIVIAILFLLYMGSSLVHSTKAFWGKLLHRRNAGVKQPDTSLFLLPLPTKAKHMVARPAVHVSAARGEHQAKSHVPPE